MSQLTTSNMPQHEAADYSISYSPPSPSSSASSDSVSDTASSQCSYETQLTNLSVERLVDSGSEQLEPEPRPLQKSHTYPSWGRESTPYSNIESTRWPQTHQLHHHPRRTAATLTHPPPSLVRNTERKDQFVNNLVDSATCMVEVIWPLAACDRHNLSLRTYIQEILKRTKTSFSTLQVALFYLLLIKAHVPMIDFTKEQPRDMATIRGFQCGRRMFLTAIILASKYLQDRNYSSKAWSKITSLPVEEINANETAFLRAVNWKLHVAESKFERWQNILIKYSQPSFVERWKEAVKVLRPELDNLPPLSFNLPGIRIDTAVPSIASYPSPMVLSPSARFMGPASPAVSPRGISSLATGLESPVTMIPPFAPKIERLSTPRFNEPATPVYQTPAVGFGNGKPASMRSAMSLVNNASLARSVQDCVPVRPFGIIGGLAGGLTLPPVRSHSSASSPESMISDNSSQASRSSSISSVSGHSLHQSFENTYRLAHVAQMNNLKANMQPIGVLTSSPEDIVIEECISASPSPSEFENNSRKRARGSLDSAMPEVEVESTLQLKTRSLLRGQAHRVGSPLPRMALSSNELQDRFAKLAALQDTLPPQKRFRAEVECPPETWRPQGGPGMWKNILY